MYSILKVSRHIQWIVKTRLQFCKEKDKKALNTDRRTSLIMSLLVIRNVLLIRIQPCSSTFVYTCVQESLRQAFSNLVIQSIKASKKVRLLRSKREDTFMSKLVQPHIYSGLHLSLMVYQPLKQKTFTGFAQVVEVIR